MAGLSLCNAKVENKLENFEECCFFPLSVVFEINAEMTCEDSVN